MSRKESNAGRRTATLTNSEQLFFTDPDNPAEVGLGRIVLTSAQDRRLDLVAYYTALMEADHRAVVQKSGAKAEAREEKKVDRSRRDWRGSQSTQDLAEDQVLVADGATRHLRNTQFVPQAVPLIVAEKQGKETRDAIQGSGRRSIPKGSVGRGSMADRTQQSLHVDASGRTGGTTTLGPQKTTLHRPQGFGGKSGAITFV
jgi:hypothetical protein